jgi:hypothetical protein
MHVKCVMPLSERPDQTAAQPPPRESAADLSLTTSRG